MKPIKRIIILGFLYFVIRPSIQLLNALKFLVPKSYWPEMEKRRYFEYRKQRRLGYKISYIDRGEDFSYQEGSKLLYGCLTWCDGIRFYLDSINKWEKPVIGQELTDEEKWNVVKRCFEFFSNESNEITLVSENSSVWIRKILLKDNESPWNEWRFLHHYDEIICIRRKPILHRFPASKPKVYY